MHATMQENTTMNPSGSLVSFADVSAAILAGKCLSIAGDEQLLRQLPAGQWIGGTIPYFMGQEGGKTTKGELFMTEMPCFGKSASIAFYSQADLHKVCLEAPDNGYTLMVLPAFSDIHTYFAKEGMQFKDMFMKPLVGWVSGFHLGDTGASAKVMNGRTLQMDDKRAIVMHVALPAEKMARVEIVNLFKQGSGDVIRVAETGFTASNCTVNGKPMRLSDYVTQQKIDTRLPLVADYSGAAINVCIKEVRSAEQEVDFYGPLFPGVDYRFAAPIVDYVAQFKEAVPAEAFKANFACNCILNYLYLELEGKKVSAVLGPMTFGEIAYQLVNQTLVYLIVE
jgi:hypothetical protein